MRWSGPYINLCAVPLVHTQRFDLGDVRAQLAVQRRAPHAQEDADLEFVSQSPMLLAAAASSVLEGCPESCAGGQGITYAPAGPSCASSVDWA